MSETPQPGPSDAPPVAELSETACRSLLASQYVGRLGYVLDDRPVIVPVNFRMTEDGTLLVLSRPGAKLDAAVAGAWMCLEVDGTDDLRHSGWSVLATGRSEVIADGQAAELIRAERLRPWPKASDGMMLIRLTPETLEGRQVRGGAPRVADS